MKRILTKTFESVLDRSKLNYSEVLKEFRNIGDHDSWGSAMNAFFDVAHELFIRNIEIPDHWEFSPGAGKITREEDSYFAMEVAQHASNNALIKFGNLMERYTRILDRAGKSY